MVDGQPTVADLAQQLVRHATAARTAAVPAGSQEIGQPDRPSSQQQTDQVADPSGQGS